MSKLSDDMKRAVAEVAVKHGVENLDDVLAANAIAMNSFGKATIPALKAHATMGHGRFAYCTVPPAWEKKAKKTAAKRMQKEWRSCSCSNC